jgi:hypothetical protein
MTIDKNLTRRFLRSTLVMTGLVVSASVGAGMLAGPANAQWNGHQQNYRHNWNGGYYRAPPVVYGSTYGYSYYGAPNYYPPPIVYGPTIAIPGVVVRIN